MNCHYCGKPATCYGSYEGIGPHYSCNDCCGHGNEDGWCRPIYPEEMDMKLRIEVENNKKE